MRCNLTWTCPWLKRAGICCTSCKNRDTCPDACQNNPDSCVMSREGTARETAFDYGIKYIKRAADLRKIEETGEPLGMYYHADCSGSWAVDNRTGTPVASERFETSDESVLWLVARVDADGKGCNEC